MSFIVDIIVKFCEIFSIYTLIYSRYLSIYQTGTAIQAMALVFERSRINAWSQTSYLLPKCHMNLQEYREAYRDSYLSRRNNNV